MSNPIRVTVWNEFRHEKKDAQIAAVYPEGMHGAIAEGLQAQPGLEVRTATLDEPEHGLTDEVLAEHRRADSGGATWPTARCRTRSSTACSSACSTAWA